MKRLFGLALLFLAVSAIPVEAQFSAACNNGGGSGNGRPPLGPWYQYWPLEAHFVLPASPQYPYWPAPMTLPSTAQQMQPQVRGGYQQYGVGYPPQGGMGGYSPYGGMQPMQGQGNYPPYGGYGYGYGGMAPR